jgi:hypothetical protein
LKHIVGTQRPQICSTHTYCGVQQKTFTMLVIHIIWSNVLNITIPVEPTILNVGNHGRCFTMKDIRQKAKQLTAKEKSKNVKAKNSYKI